MATRQTELPIAAIVYDSEGTEILRHRLGRLPRDHATALDLDELTGIEALRNGYGHVELVYDFSAGGEADGWLHAIFRYRRRSTGHAAETSFGAHVFNTILTYRNEPQSYSGRPPGLSTRLFLRLGDDRYDTLCQLIYPASRPWRPLSATEIILYDRTGCETATARMAIPCSGSRLWRYHDAIRCGDPRPRRNRRLCDHSRHDLPAVRLSRAARGERCVQPRPHVRLLANAGGAAFRRAAREYIVLSD